MEMQRYGIVKMILIEKDKFREVMLPDSRFITKLTQGSVVLAKGRHKWNRRARPEIDPIYNELFFKVGAKAIS